MTIDSDFMKHDSDLAERGMFRSYIIYDTRLVMHYTRTNAVVRYLRKCARLGEVGAWPRQFEQLKLGSAHSSWRLRAH